MLAAAAAAAPGGDGRASASIEAIVANSTRVAESFVSRYYTAQDLDPQERPGPVQQLYAPTARVTWNGNPIAYADLPAFVQQMPKSAHEVQAFDCHPISGSASGAAPPSLVVTVSGQVAHGPNPTPSAGSINSKNFDQLPRVFSQSFILVYTGPGQGEDGYTIASDSFRFC
ncbi:hypothetical protein C6P46_006252 [Rhodotorula mucilaginosa]|uniref:NTF2 domain-containing protein n=1 Tax=Rhodotorula mucilaginosa TaxID=5537 RepID=A0A9P6VYH1_RHOMI|nr:hypothetical protein C6P46_006252 [Rhodotorula mucilaginosa]